MTEDEPIGKWLSAALEDPSVCEEMKADIRAWFARRSVSPPEGALGERIAELRGLMAKGTPGPWDVAWHSYVTELGDFACTIHTAHELSAKVMCHIERDVSGQQDAALIVAAINALPELLDAAGEVERLRAALDLVLQNVEASASSYQERVEVIGRVALRALGEGS